MYEVRMSDYHDAKLVSTHRTERGAVKAALQYDRTHGRECECGGCTVYNDNCTCGMCGRDGHRMRVIIPDGVPIGGSREGMAYLEEA